LLLTFTTSNHKQAEKNILYVVITPQTRIKLRVIFDFQLLLFNDKVLAVTTDKKCCRRIHIISFGVISFFFIIFLKATASGTETRVRQNKSEGKHLVYFPVI